MEEIKPKPPAVISEKIERVETELKKYAFEKLIENGKNRILVTIQRKGTIIIEQLKQDKDINKKFEESFLQIITLDEFLKSNEFHDKKIIIFDDSIDEGNRIKEFLDSYREILDLDDGEFLRYRKKNIKIGAFLVNGKSFKKLVNNGLIDEEMIGNIEVEKRFFEGILDIITYIIHKGDIIDPDHLIIRGKFKEPVAYSKIWDVLKYTNDRLYEPDFEFFHPEKKKITLYDLPCHKWVDVNQLNIKDEKFQCLVRFVFDVIQVNQDLFLTEFQLAPVTNPKIKMGYTKNCTNFEPQLCKNQIKTDECCVDCILYQLIMKVLSGFWQKWYSNLEKNKIIISDLEISWKQMDSKYDKVGGKFYSPAHLEKIIFKSI